MKRSLPLEADCASVNVVTGGIRQNPIFGMTEVNNSWFLVTIHFYLMFSGQMLTNLSVS
jgi:hypothetical protein